VTRAAAAGVDAGGMRCAALRDAVINFRHPRRRVPFTPR